MFCRTDDFNLRSISRTALCRNRDEFRPFQILSSQGFRACHDIFRRPLGNNPSPVFSGCRPDIENIIGRPHGIFVVFYDNQGISQVAEMLQGTEQFVIVPLMKADRRFIENIQDADQTRTYLRSQADALGFPA